MSAAMSHVCRTHVARDVARLSRTRFGTVCAGHAGFLAAMSHVFAFLARIRENVRPRQGLPMPVFALVSHGFRTSRAMEYRSYLLLPVVDVRPSAESPGIGRPRNTQTRPEQAKRATFRHRPRSRPNSVARQACDIPRDMRATTVRHGGDQ